jgi:hypothetical protein
MNAGPETIEYGQESLYQILSLNGVRFIFGGIHIGSCTSIENFVPSFHVRQLNLVCSCVMKPTRQSRFTLYQTFYVLGYFPTFPILDQITLSSKSAFDSHNLFGR